MQYRLIGPPGLVIEEGVLGKPARVDHAILRTDVRPLIGRRLAAVIEPGPYEAAGNVRSCAYESPPSFCRCPSGRGVGIVRTDSSFGGFRNVGPARPYRADVLRADNRDLRVILVPYFGLRVGIVIAHDVAYCQAAFAHVISRRWRRNGYRSRWILLQGRLF